ncbi:hypothetical protein [Jannaschia rubra]|uniref:Uncharacterized protein n=2 Tax=Jannaschia rubra TaxID=282197 RepID=A0A0M6XWI6_9RHOB|nr:hypothetical protein [Jannaschia rubra]CTQ34294.1 hypothetical protein JAN5088_03088 [Jannaschia rubra]SFG18601.1 hypothetical protein SAMN04488517_10349 [Jannaschia rubra]
MRPILALVLSLAATPALAERIVTPDEFDAMVTGRTLHFDRHGEAYGAEQYFEDKRVIWSFEDGECQRGIWFANTRGQICFVYDSDPTPQCWDFLEADDGAFRARLDGDEAADDLVTRNVGNDALDCPLPDLGV